MRSSDEVVPKDRHRVRQRTETQITVESSIEVGESSGQRTQALSRPVGRPLAATRATQDERPPPTIPARANVQLARNPAGLGLEAVVESVGRRKARSVRPEGVGLEVHVRAVDSLW